MFETSIIINISIVALVLLVYMKTRKVHLKQYELERKIDSICNKKLDELFCQIESLIGLYLDLGLRKSLPLTRGWAGSPDFLHKLSQYTIKTCPQTVVECSSGVSTLVLAKCLQINGFGHVYSLDHDPGFAQKTRDNLLRHGLSEWATVIVAPLQEYQFNGQAFQWYGLEMLPNDITIDLLVIDGPPMDTGLLARYPAGPMFFNHMALDGGIFIDDADRPTEKAVLDSWKNEFPEFTQTNLYCEKGCLFLSRSAA